MPKIIVLGSNSFSGQDFIDLLLDDPENDVIGISRSPQKHPAFLRYEGRGDLSRFRFYQLDLNRDMPGILALLDAEKPDAIVNFAAQSDVGASWIHPADWFRTNCAALAELLAHLHKAKYLERYVQIGSPEAYGSCEDATEDAPFNPSTPYAASKAAADLLLQVYIKQGFPAIIARPTNVYGARQQIHKFIPRAMINLRLDKTIELRGGGEAIKSYIHIRDVSRGIALLMREGETGQAYHLGAAAGVSIHFVASLICELLGKDFDEWTQSAARHIGRDAMYIVNSGKANALGWRPEVSLDEGLRETCAWIDMHLADNLMPMEYRHAA